ncbi:MAG: hypothetical protein WBF33_22745 [Candidatus Nitrosopolaris sp.]
MYNENHVDRSPKLKRRSTRHVSEITAIASEFGNSAKIIVPRLCLMATQSSCLSTTSVTGTDQGSICSPRLISTGLQHRSAHLSMLKS